VPQRVRGRRRARAFTSARKHRLFAGVSLSPVGIEIAPEALSVGEFGRLYSHMSGGIGYGITGPDNLHDTYFLSNIAVGYT
jgi:hypothetical protein